MPSHKGKVAELQTLLDCEQEMRREAEEECEALQTHLKAMYREFAHLQKCLDDERGMRKEAEEECEALQANLKAMHRKVHDGRGLQAQLSKESKKNDELNAQLQMKKSASALSHGASWQYEVDGRWEAYLWRSAQVELTVDFKLMQQKRLGTRKIRKIRVSAGVPLQWATPAADLLQQGDDLGSFYVEINDPLIWQRVQKIMHRSGHAQGAASGAPAWAGQESNHVKSVHRIENMRLWHRYKMRLDTMRQDHASNISVGSALDLDGYGMIMATSWLDLNRSSTAARHWLLMLMRRCCWDLLGQCRCHSPRRVWSSNFQGFYGAGVYFACAACKSHHTCEHFTGLQAHHKSNHKCERTLILARVALGDSYIAKETRKGERRPPVRRHSSRTHDSIVVKPGMINGHHNQEQVHQEYVIFDREQAYPSYVVQYKVWTVDLDCGFKNCGAQCSSSGLKKHWHQLHTLCIFVQWQGTNPVTLFFES